MKQKIEFMGKQKIELMGHVVAGYPTIYSCLGAATGILKGGANFLEVQFPFSDGNADGILIQEASDYSLKHGFIPKHGFTIIEGGYNFLLSKSNDRPFILWFFGG